MKSFSKTQNAKETIHNNVTSGLSKNVEDSLNTLADRTETKRGNFSITDKSISGSSTYTHNISLTDSDWKFGYVLLWLPNDTDITNVVYRRKAAIVYFDTTQGNSVSEASKTVFTSFTILLQTYNIYEWYWYGYRYNEDSVLSPDEYAEDNTSINIRSCYINGSNLEIIFRNTSGSSKELTINGEYRVFRMAPG